MGVCVQPHITGVNPNPNLRVASTDNQQRWGLQTYNHKEQILANNKNECGSGFFPGAQR